jgi:hypothetical protein
LGRKLRIAW